jgi:hypothetical protein
MKKDQLLIFFLAIVGVMAVVGGIVGHYVGLEQGFTSGLTAGLILVTAFYAVDTNRMRRSSEKTAEAAIEQARAAEEQARASVKMAEEMRQQRISAEQPVVWPAVLNCKHSSPYDRVTEITFNITLANIGNGPALDVHVYLGWGSDPRLADCLHDMKSYIRAGREENSRFVLSGSAVPFSSPTTTVAEYMLIVQWRVLYLEAGPFFEARMPLQLRLAGGDLSYELGHVQIEQKAVLQIRGGEAVKSEKSGPFIARAL